jgi:hypothetical protein
MDGELAHLSWNAASKDDEDRMGFRRHEQRARRSRHDAAQLREAERLAQLTRIAQLQQEILNEKRLEQVARERTKALASANRRLSEHRQALDTHRQRKAEGTQKRAEYQVRAPWNKAEADPRPWVVFLHDPDDESRFHTHAHESTLRPLGGVKHYPEGHFADFARQELGPRCGIMSDSQQRLQSQKMAAKARELMLELTPHGRTKRI